MTPDEFKRAFHARTLAYLPGFRGDARPVVVIVGESAHSAPGHVLLLGLINMLARAHQRIVVVGDLGGELRCHDAFGSRSLEHAVGALATGINPFIDLELARKHPTGEVLMTLGLAARANLRIGCEGWRARFDTDAEIASRADSVMGAILASCLGAATAFHRQVGRNGQVRGWYSLWDYVLGSGVQGPRFEGSLDIGRVLQVGAGAVGSALDYWMSFLGFVGPWTVADGDVVDVTNLNRQLFFLAGDAGWQRPGAVNKAAAVAGRLGTGAMASPHMYGLDKAVVEADYDVILPLANEGGVRPALQSRAEPVLLHATTTRNWTAIAHRHTACIDDCIVCRLPAEEDPTFTCSTASTGSEGRNDASLPFLAGMAGALLIRDLAALQLGRLLERETNFASINLGQPEPFTAHYRWVCRDDCSARLPEDVRRELTPGIRFVDFH